METPLTFESNDKTANLLFNLIRTQNLDVKIKIQQLLGQDIDMSLMKRDSLKEEARPYSIDELFGILKDSNDLSYDEMREEYFKNKYQL